jgi:hypothetical protein
MLGCGKQGPKGSRGNALDVGKASVVVKVHAVVEGEGRRMAAN